MQGGKRINGYEKKSEQNLPLVSIITVVLNGEKHLEQTFNSVFHQNYPNIEYIVIDGGSKDKTIEIIKQYESNIDYWQSEKDNGIYYAMNKGIELAKGDLIGILNADDYYSENTVRYVVDTYLKTNADIIHGDILFITESTASRMKPDFKQMNVQPSIFHPTCFVKKAVYQIAGSFDTTYKISADYDFLLRCIRKNFVFEYIPEVLSHFRPGGMSASCASNIEGYKIMKVHQTGYHNAVAWRAVKCYTKTFLKKLINLFKNHD
ncbi:MAG: glycosyltransferase [Bacteroidetes bacterium]|nr:glycosyltransferase [Bacteroidota bacterium]